MLSQRLLEYSLVGAEWVLWVLVALSAISLAVIADRVLFYLRTRERIGALEPVLTGALARRDWDGARNALAGDSLVRNVVRAGVDVVAGGAPGPAPVEQAMLGALAREKTRYEARLTVLATIGNNVPFVGLFGTVLGIVEAFHQLGQASAASGTANTYVMGAIGEALVATAVGILVAIPAVAAFNFLRSHVSGRVKQAETLMRAMLSGLGAARPAGEG